MRKSWDNAWLFAEKVGNGGKGAGQHDPILFQLGCLSTEAKNGRAAIFEQYQKQMF